MKGLLLLNLGSPKAPTSASVRCYLRDFLSDPRVIDLPWLPRMLLLYLFILPFRPRRSARAYRQIWTEEGSPLLVHGRTLKQAVQERLGSTWQVELAMRYGQPSIAGALRSFDQAGVQELVAFPLYPQYASSTTGSSLEALYQEAARGARVPALEVVPAFYREDVYLEAQAQNYAAALEGKDSEHLVFSFHGLPERQLGRADPTTGHCLKRADCCEQASPAHATCYRHQCFATAKALAQRLGLEAEGWSISFQSRLGRTPWLSPYTDQHLRTLASQGVKRIALGSPAFVADCLETLEELGIRGRRSFLEAGGEHFELLPALNCDPMWVEAVATLACKHAGGGR